MKYLCKIKMLDGSRFEFETDNDDVMLSGSKQFYVVQSKDKEVFLNPDNAVYISFTKGDK